MTDVLANIKVDIEHNINVSDELMPLLFMNYEHFEHDPAQDTAYDMGIRLIFYWEGRIINALLFGTYDQGGEFVLQAFSAQSGQIRAPETGYDETSEHWHNDLVAFAMDLFREYVSAQGEPGAPLLEYDLLTLDYLPIDYPHNAG